MNLTNKQVSLPMAAEIAEALKESGKPAPGKMLLIMPKGEQRTESGIIIPGDNEKDLPRKGVVIQFTQLQDLKDQVFVGNIITFGMYAGKEIEFTQEQLPMVDFQNYKFTILSESEVIYIESNTNK